MEHYNANYYSEWFNNKMNMTVTEYIRILRIKKAKELLSNTNLPILQIAQMIDYDYNSSFTRAFKECEQIFPAELRRNLKIR
ncbi:helix-turn-helix transcriptional regulator [uncultured Clostridium sp.]|uniref:helix-turn-helix domain-containing protein n=1 Tax=uncultured Clostridium sp. TaxID=59620 RepID=UPI0025E3864D|nr:helix-turn-helix transcriptional regulator [uncultured Clostridium sp.]